MRKLLFGEVLEVLSSVNANIKCHPGKSYMLFSQCPWLELYEMETSRAVLNKPFSTVSVFLICPALEKCTIIRKKNEIDRSNMSKKIQHRSLFTAVLCLHIRLGSKATSGISCLVWEWSCCLFL